MTETKTLTKQEAFEILKNSPFINQFISKNDEKKSGFHVFRESITLTGGAIIDILEGRTPKDYDFFGGAKILKKLGFEFTHSSRTADTYVKGDVTAQILKLDIKDFDFTISTATLDIKANMTLVNFGIDMESFNSKILKPCEQSWYKVPNAIATLSRIPHFRDKGYTIPDVTYGSLLGVVRKGVIKNSM